VLLGSIIELVLDERLSGLALARCARHRHNPILRPFDELAALRHLDPGAAVLLDLNDRFAAVPDDGSNQVIGDLDFDGGLHCLVRHGI